MNEFNRAEEKAPARSSAAARRLVGANPNPNPNPKGTCSQLGGCSAACRRLGSVADIKLTLFIYAYLYTYLLILARRLVGGSGRHARRLLMLRACVSGDAPAVPAIGAACPLTHSSLLLAAGLAAALGGRVLAELAVGD